MFDYDSLVVPDDVSAAPIVKVLKRKIQVGKPTKVDFFRVRPGADFKLGPVNILEMQPTHSTIVNYLVAPSVVTHLQGHLYTAKLVTCCTRQGRVFLWPVKQLGAKAQDSIWFQTAREAAVLAEHDWVRIMSVKDVDGYQISVASAVIAEPEWPGQSFEELMEIAFSGKIIESPDHSVVRELAGLQ